MAAVITGSAKGLSFFAQLKQGFHKWKFESSDYRKYGLLSDDVTGVHHSPVVEEAIRRLPQEIQDIRTYRVIRAAQASLRHEYLPKDQWTTYEQDIGYLRPYIAEVMKEFQERKEWDSK